MEIFPICIWLVTELSPYAYGRHTNPRRYAYGDPFFCNPHMHTGIKVTLHVHMGISSMHTGSNLDPHSGSTRDSRKDCSYIRIWSPYAYRDSPYAYGEEGKKSRIWGLPVHLMKLCAYGDQHTFVRPFLAVSVLRMYLLLHAHTLFFFFLVLAVIRVCTCQF
jgi:hypothetical protein